MLFSTLPNTVKQELAGTFKEVFFKSPQLLKELINSSGEIVFFFSHKVRGISCYLPITCADSQHFHKYDQEGGARHKC